MKGKLDFGRVAAVLVSLAVGGSVLCFCLPPLLGIAAPFLAAIAIAGLARRLAAFLSRRLHIPERGLAAAIALALPILVFALGFLLLRRLLREGLGLLASITADGGIFSFLQQSEMEGILYSMINAGVSRLVSALSSFAGRALLSVPSAFLALVVTMIASVYFALELPRIGAWLSRLPPWPSARLARLRQGALQIASGLLCAYGILFLVTFACLSVGLLALRVRYALFVALLFSLIDLLPIIGVGALLIPWSLLSCLSGRASFGLALLLLWLALAVLRRVLEPRLFADRLGLHPIASLASLYVGIKLFGGLGAIIGPLAAALISGAVKEMKGEKRRATDDG